MKKRVGFFGGSFDPIHFGHVHLAIQLFEIHGLDEVLFCPAACSPLKMRDPPFAKGEDRFAMLQRALEGIAHFQITPLEIERGSPSYTIDTLKALKAPGMEFHLLLSEEAASTLPLWKEAQELLELAPPLVGARSGAFSYPQPFAKVLKKGHTQTKIFEVSSTEVRERLKKGLYCGHLVPAKALDYICRHRLYSA